MCVHGEVERRGGGNIGKEVDLKNYRTIDLSTISVSRSFFGRFLLFRICIFINDLSLGEKCSVNNIPFLFPESPKREGRGFDRAILSGELLTRFVSLPIKMRNLNSITIERIKNRKLYKVNKHR